MCVGSFTWLSCKVCQLLQDGCMRNQFFIIHRAGFKSRYYGHHTGRFRFFIACHKLLEYGDLKEQTEKNPEQTFINWCSKYLQQ